VKERSGGPSAQPSLAAPFSTTFIRGEARWTPHPLKDRGDDDSYAVPATAFELRAEKHVSSHNDVLPRNVLFDGKRLWLIDWENSYRNDPLVDLGTALDNFAPSPELEEVLLLAWLGHEPDHLLRNRLALVRALTRLFYTGVLFSASALSPRARPDPSLAAPTSEEFEQAIRDGRLLAGTPETTHVLGKMFLTSFFSGAVPPGLPPMHMR
jgi:hypothetical protein